VWDNRQRYKLLGPASNILVMYKVNNVGKPSVPRHLKVRYRYGDKFDRIRLQGAHPMLPARWFYYHIQSDGKSDIVEFVLDFAVTNPVDEVMVIRFEPRFLKLFASTAPDLQTIPPILNRPLSPAFSSGQSSEQDTPRALKLTSANIVSTTPISIMASHLRGGGGTPSTGARTPHDLEDIRSLVRTPGVLGPPLRIPVSTPPEMDEQPSSDVAQQEPPQTTTPSPAWPMPLERITSMLDRVRSYEDSRHRYEGDDLDESNEASSEEVQKRAEDVDPTKTTGEESANNNKGDMFEVRGSQQLYNAMADDVLAQTMTLQKQLQATWAKYRTSTEEDEDEVESSPGFRFAFGAT